MWFVLITTAGRSLGFDLPHVLLPTAVSLGSLQILLRLLPYAIATAVTALVLAYVFERFKRHLGKSDERWRPVGLDRLAHDTALEPENISRWQQAQVLYVEHGLHGRVTNAYTSRPD